jgi:antitoxin VapB
VALTIENPETERLARELAEKDWRERGRSHPRRSQEGMPFAPTRFPSDGSAYRALKEFQEAMAKLPILDHRSADEILGYDESGLPH